MPYSPPPQPPAIILVRSPETNSAPETRSQPTEATIFSQQQPKVAYRATIWYRLPQTTSEETEVETKALELGPPLEMGLPSSSKTTPTWETIWEWEIGNEELEGVSFYKYEMLPINSWEANPEAVLEGIALGEESGVQPLKCRQALFGEGFTVESSPKLWLSDCLLLPTTGDRSFSSSPTDNLQQQQRQLSLEEFSQRRQQPPEAEEEEEIEVPLPADVIEVTADRQEFDQRRQIITAQGNVLIRFRQGVIDADRVQVNLETRQLIAQGNAAFTRGEQVLRGETMAYNLTLGTGQIERASGELFVPSTGTDFSGQPAFRLPFHHRSNERMGGPGTLPA